MTKFMNKLVELISRPPEQRSDDIVNEVIPWLRKKAAGIFANAVDEVMRDIVKHCEYRPCLRDDVIILQGDIGDEFYVILSGKTSIFIDATKTGETQTFTSKDEEDDEKRKNGGKTKLTGAARMQQLLQQFEQDDKNKKEQTNAAAAAISREKAKYQEFDRKLLGNFIFQLEAGKCFGEIALMTDDAVRNASIIADEDTDLLVVSRDLFNRAFKAQQEKEYEERHTFIDNCFLFSWWSTRFNRLLEMSLRKEIFSYDSVIAKQGDPFRGIYFILSGRVKTYTTFCKHRHQFPVFISSAPQSSLEELFGRRKSALKSKEKAQMEMIRTRREGGYEMAENLHRRRQHEIVTLESGDSIGDIELAMSFGSYTCTYRSITTVETLVLDLHNIERLISKRNPLTIELVKDFILVKLKYWMTCLNKEQHYVDSILFKTIITKLDEEQKRRNFQYKQEKFTIYEKEILALSKLYLVDRIPVLVKPVVPGTVGVLTRAQRRSAFWEKRLLEKEKEHKEIQERASRRYYHIQARSMRQLASIKKNDNLLADDQKPPPKPISTSAEHLERQENIHRRAEMTKSILETTNVRRSETGDVISLMVLLKIMQRLHRVRKRLSMRPKSEESRSVGTFIRTAPMSAPANPFTSTKYFDYETSNDVLNDLEGRMDLFLNKFDKTEVASQSLSVAKTTEKSKVIRPKSAVTRLQRFELNPDKIPQAGGTVMVKSRPCTASTERHHQHIRRYMLPSNALHILQAHSAVQLKRDI